MRFAAVKLYLLADLLYVHRHSGNITDRFHIPDSAEQLFLAEYAVRMLCEKCQQIEFFRRKLDFLAIYKDTVRGLVDLQAADLYDFILWSTGSDQPLIAGQVRFHPGNKFAWRKRFCDIVVRTQTKSPDLINVVFFRGDHKNRHILDCADFPADLKPVNIRQHEIQNEQIIISLQGRFEPGLSVGLDIHLKITQFKVILFQIGNGFLIFHYQNSAHILCSHPLLSDPRREAGPLGLRKFERYLAVYLPACMQIQGSGCQFIIRQNFLLRQVFEISACLFLNAVLCCAKPLMESKYASPLAEGENRGWWDRGEQCGGEWTPEGEPSVNPVL